MLSILKNDGLLLKKLLENEGFTVKNIVKRNIKNLKQANIYYYFGQKKIKREIIEKILTSLDIPVEKFYYQKELTNVSITDFNKDVELEPKYISTHQGKNLRTYLNNKNINITGFASTLNISKPTLYKYFTEKELPIGFLLEVVTLLNIPVAAIKGYGESSKSFEKDVYLELKSINEKIDRLFLLIKFTN